MNELLKENGLKLTKQRKIVLDLINDLGDEATLKNISQSCSSKVDNSTVYRIIDLFLEKGILEKMVNFEEKIYYSVKEEHNHYFTCIKCHRREKLDDCPIENVNKKYKTKKGYTILNHVVVINGICDKCNEKK